MDKNNQMFYLIIGLIFILFSFIMLLIIIILLDREDLINYHNNLIDIFLRNKTQLLLLIFTIICISFGLIFLVYYLSQILINLENKPKPKLKDRLTNIYLKLRKFQD